MSEIFEQLDQLRLNEKRVAMVTLVATRGTTPKNEGATIGWARAGASPLVDDRRLRRSR